ncbi:hypothetical protein JCM10207_008467 [Rhodosporidiobolus poonsookiae]
MASRAPQPQSLAPDAPHPLPRLPSRTASPLDWLPVLSLPVPFSLDNFTNGILDLVHQPEHSSTTILRADILEDDDAPAPDAFPLEGYRSTRRIRRRILPSRPQFDHAMEQECLFYERTVGDTPDDVEGAVFLLPDFEQLKMEDPHGRLPYYHPQCHALAFRYLPASLSSSTPPAPALRIDLVPLPSPSSSPSQPAPAALKPTDRLYRTALALVKFSSKVCAGKADGWQKRVHHDLLAGKEQVQDLYQVLKDKYKTNLHPPSPHSPRLTFRWLLHAWKEGTDPEKHVFEDVAIAAWLVCVWRALYPDTDGKPPGGFVDVGCGNGLLVYILNAEGFPGYGFDLRARKSWASYAPAPDLRVLSLDPVALLSSAFPAPSSAPSSPADEPDPAAETVGTVETVESFPRDAFLIGNHADELTPWLPLLAASTPGRRVGFLNIPCCLHEHVGRFERQAFSVPAEVLAAWPAPSVVGEDEAGEGEGATHPLLAPFYAPTPALAPATTTTATGQGGRYHAYQLYLASLTLQCGFVPEREALRIPSTKNFGMLGRRRLWGAGEEEEEEGRRRVGENVRRLVQEVQKKGEWRARRPEGKAGH